MSPKGNRRNSFSVVAFVSREPGSLGQWKARPDSCFSLVGGTLNFGLCPWSPGAGRSLSGCYTILQVMGLVRYIIPWSEIIGPIGLPVRTRVSRFYGWSLQSIEERTCGSGDSEKTDTNSFGWFWCAVLVDLQADRTVDNKACTLQMFLHLEKMTSGNRRPSGQYFGVTEHYETLGCIKMWALLKIREIKIWCFPHRP